MVFHLKAPLRTFRVFKLNSMPLFSISPRLPTMLAYPVKLFVGRLPNKLLVFFWYTSIAPLKRLSNNAKSTPKLIVFVLSQVSLVFDGVAILNPLPPGRKLLRWACKISYEAAVPGAGELPIKP
ncbi:hypothetical protein D3C86_1132600 [compost metagenome]